MLELDTSDSMIADIFLQFNPADEQWYPVTFFSKTMALAEYNYEIYNKEILAIIYILE